uniref:Uncharacterized protein n=1 Tax=Amphimedon queenslandica TaxID=400682 RepID=A0A1X7SXI3_AMPQE
MLKSYYNYTT